MFIAFQSRKSSSFSPSRHYTFELVITHLRMFEIPYEFTKKYFIDKLKEIEAIFISLE